MFVLADFVPKVEHHLAEEPFLRNDIAAIGLDKEFAELLVFGFGEILNLFVDGFDKIFPEIIFPIGIRNIYFVLGSFFFISFFIFSSLLLL